MLATSFLKTIGIPDEYWCLFSQAQGKNERCTNHKMQKVFALWTWVYEALDLDCVAVLWIATAPPQLHIMGHTKVYKKTPDSFSLKDLLTKFRNNSPLLMTAY